MVDYLKSFPQDDQGNPIRPPKYIHQGSEKDGCSSIIFGLPIVLAITAATAYAALLVAALAASFLCFAAQVPFTVKDVHTLVGVTIYSTIATLGVAYLWKPSAESKRITRFAKKAITIALGAYTIACCASAIYHKCTERRGYGKCPAVIDAIRADERTAVFVCPSPRMQTAKTAQARQNWQLPEATAQYKMAARALSQRIASQAKQVAAFNTIKGNRLRLARYG